MAVDLTNIVPNVVTSSLIDKIWLFYGEMATRKTSVACSFPNHILLAFDIGYKFINGANAVPLQTWMDFKAAVRQLDNTKVKSKYDCVIIDTIGMAYQACYQYMLSQMGVSDPGEAGKFGIGWKKIRNEFEMTIRSIAQKGYGLIMLAHSDEVEREDKVSKQKYMSVKIDIDKRPDLIIQGLADFVFYLHKEEHEVTKQPTVYAYSNLVDIDTKSRAMYFSPKFEFTYDNLQLELTKAIDEMRAHSNNMTVSDNPTNYYSTTNTDFTALKEAVVAKAQELIETQQKDAVVEYLTNIFKGERVSDLVENQMNLDKLQVANATFDDLLSQLK